MPKKITLRKKLTADFETTTNEDDCRVWAWGVCDIYEHEYFDYGNSLDGFIEYCKSLKNPTMYFHNLRFDGEFILNWLFQNGYKHVEKRKDEKSKTFSTLISDTGQFYSMKIIFYKDDKKSKFVQFIDSLKILPFSVSQVAKGFNLPISKLELDYTAERKIGHEITETEKDYLRNDVEIMARALRVLFDQELDKMTQAGNAFKDYKNVFGKKNFERCFPVPTYDADVRQSYKGGFTYLNPKYKSKDIKTGLVFDVNSLYPWAMHDCPLPYGTPIFFRGKYEYDKLYPLYVTMFTCQFELKPEHIPTIQLKNNLSFIPTEYVTSSKDEFITMCLTSVDFELFMEHYDVFNIEFHSGWKFKASTELFKEYIDKWTAVKIESTLNGNKAMRTLAKLMLNALYGRFALSPRVASKIPYYDNGIVKYRMSEWEERDPIYIPVGTFITAWARHKTITTAQKLYDCFVYADTDSVHLDVEIPESMQNMSNSELEKLTGDDLKRLGLELPDGFDVDPVALGAWKLEEKFERGRYLRQKSYIHDYNKPEVWDNPEMYEPSLLSITCAGMPDRCYQYVTWENFQEGATFKGKLMPKHVHGGMILNEIEFTIRKT